jgi:hypothetical protein
MEHIYQTVLEEYKKQKYTVFKEEQDTQTMQKKLEKSFWAVSWASSDKKLID